MTKLHSLICADCGEEILDLRNEASIKVSKLYHICQDCIDKDSIFDLIDLVDTSDHEPEWLTKP